MNNLKCSKCNKDTGAYPYKIYDGLGKRRNILCAGCYKVFEQWLIEEENEV